MIERKFLKQNVKEYMIHEYISKELKNVGHSHTKLLRTPLGEKIIIFASRPGLVVGRKGENIKKLTAILKKKFQLENPQIEISEIAKPNLDAQIVAERIASTLERFGPQRFKAIGHKVLQEVMQAGALGVEIKMKGIVPAGRKKTWRFSAGYMKKSGQVAVDGVNKAYAEALLKRGVEGIEVRIMPPDLILPDKIRIIPEDEVVIVEKVEQKPRKKSKKRKKSVRKKTAKKKVSEEKNEEVTATPEEVKDVVAENKEEPVEEKEEKSTETPAVTEESTKSLEETQA